MSAEARRSGRLAAVLRRLARSHSTPLIGLGIAIVAALALNLWARGHIYFFYDEYEIVLHRYSLHDVLEPTNGHPVIMWLPIFYLLRAVFGLGSSLPFELVGVLAMVAATCVLFAYLSSRAGRWVALAGATLLLFLGAGADILFWPFQLAFAGSVGTGLGALLLLSGDRRHRDAGAAALLVASVFFLAVGLAFVAAAVASVVVATGLERRRRLLRRLAVVVGPALVLYAIWYLAYGHDSPSRISFENVVGAPLFIVNGIGASLAMLAGLAGDPTDPAAISWGIPLLAGLVGLATWRVVSGRPIAPTVWVGLTGALAFWALTGINKPLGAMPDAGRYDFIGAIFALIVLVELVRGLRPSQAMTGLAAGLVLVSVVGNLSGYRYGHSVLTAEAENDRAVLGALELARGHVDPNFRLVPEASGSDFLVVVDARSYFKSADRYGSSALSPSQLLEEREPLRANADSVLRMALPVTLASVPQQPLHHTCASIAAGLPDAMQTVPAGKIWLRAERDGQAEVALKRFAEGFAPIGVIEAGKTARLSIPADGSSLPWKLKLTKGTVRICRA